MERVLCPEQTHAEPRITGVGPAQTPGGMSAAGHYRPSRPAPPLLTCSMTSFPEDNPGPISLQGR